MDEAPPSHQAVDAPATPEKDNMTAIAERIRKQLFQRPCWICLKFGACEHREFQVEIAIARRAEKQAALTGTDNSELPDDKQGE